MATGGSHRKCSKQPIDENQTMAENLSMVLAELLRKADAEPDVDTLCEGVRVMARALMELEVAEHLGAERYQRSPDQRAQRLPRSKIGIHEWVARGTRSSCARPAGSQTAPFRSKLSGTSSPFRRG